MSDTVITRRFMSPGRGTGAGFRGGFFELTAIVAYVFHWTASISVANSCSAVPQPRHSSPPRSAMTVAESSGSWEHNHSKRRGLIRSSNMAAGKSIP